MNYETLAESQHIVCVGWCCVCFDALVLCCPHDPICAKSQDIDEVRHPALSPPEFPDLKTYMKRNRQSDRTGLFFFFFLKKQVFVVLQASAYLSI